MRELTVGTNDGEQRLDRFLLKVFPRATTSFIQKKIRQKKIKVNHVRAESGTFLHEGDLVQIYLYEEILHPLEERRAIPTSSLRLSYAYDGAQFSVIDKPAGVLSHPADPRDYGKTVVDAFVHDRIVSGEYVPRREKSFTPALVNRLDMQTAGLLIGAKSHSAMLLLQQGLRDGRIEKHYLAYVEGIIDCEEVITLPLRTERGKSVVDPNGKPCITHVSPVKTGNGFSLIAIRLETGRTHQIRAHLSAFGHPLIGDRPYGATFRTNVFKHHLLLSSHLLFHDGEPLALPTPFNVYSKQTEQFKALWSTIAS